jgi:hypothetical protein
MSVIEVLRQLTIEYTLSEFFRRRFTVKQIAKIVLCVLCSIVAFAQEHPKPVFIKATGCESKLASVLFSSFKDSMRAGIARYEVVPDLSDYGKNDVVLVIQMACGERNNAVSIASIYGLAKCFGPRNCHQSINGTTLNLLMCDPSGEKQCGFELLKELDYVLSRTDPRSMQLE